MIKKYLITPGELDSIGLEVTLKALSSIKTTDAFIIFSNATYLKEHLHKLEVNLNIKEISSLQDSLLPGLYLIHSIKDPIDWFKEACSFCAKNPQSTALITGPLAKASFNNPSILGHTEYLRSIYKDLNLFMTFFGDKYNCLLLNDHIPLSNVSLHVSKALIKYAVDTISKLQKDLKIGLLGLNPHAGEGGLIGGEEESIHIPICEENNSLEGPLSPDGFFSSSEYEKYDFLIANYHDQGLIPFKLLNGFKASQATLGLPFVRTSVNHGTGSSLYLKNLARPDSMIHAIQLAQYLLNIKNLKE